MQQRESTLEFQSIAWKFFDFPKMSKNKLFKAWEEMIALNNGLMKEPHLGELLQRTVRNLEQNIPRMISFMDGEIDLEPWERWAYASFISSNETEVNLMSLMRDMMGLASVPALFGRALLDNHPDILLDIYDLDKGMMYFLMGLPRWTPWFPVTRAHLARARISRTLNAYHTALDATVEGRPVELAWGDLEDVNDLIWKRRAMFKDNGFAIEGGDIELLWALVVNATLLVYWQIHYILSVPGLLPLILAEITPYAYATKPEFIGRISEAPKLTLDYENLSKKCPLLKSTYLETLRLTAQPWSVRKATKDVVISEANNPASPVSFSLNKGEYVTIPHGLHMRDPKYFTDPEKFDAERFLVKNEDGSISTDSGTIRPFGEGPLMCPGRLLAEKECLAFVAGMLVFWEFQPADKSGWVVPEQKKTGGVSLPARETRVRIKKRKFVWDD
ncbi:hypothetical protein B7494_g1277 [Chlorociboria aeruginascens]|nr:hypothetical protein B7494_g1277 [Chlorociboria aeruginascens]